MPQNNILDHIENPEFVKNFENFVKFVPRELVQQTKQELITKYPTHQKTQSLLDVLARHGI